jgi:hypothetical protein
MEHGILRIGHDHFRRQNLGQEGRLSQTSDLISHVGMLSVQALHRRGIPHLRRPDDGDDLAKLDHNPLRGGGGEGRRMPYREGLGCYTVELFSQTSL